MKTVSNSYFREQIITKLQLALSTSALINNEVLSYRLPLKDIPAHVVSRDVTLILAGLANGWNDNPITVRAQRGYSWQVTSEEMKIKLITHSYRRGPRRDAPLWRVVKFDKGFISLKDLVAAAEKVSELEKVLKKENAARARERARIRKLKEHAMRFVGVTTGNSRKRVEIDSFDYDHSKPETTEINLSVVGDPKKLKRAINALAKLGVVRGRKS
jgi:hypothetical protein